MKTVIAVAALLAAAGTTLADGVAYMTAPGGAFHAATVSGYIGEPAGGDFDTFCIELNEFFSPNNNYAVTLGMSAVGGGQGGGSPDALSERTALMYSTFRAGGAFATTNFGNVVVDTDAEETALQDAVWASEDELAYASLTGLAKDLYDWADANAQAGVFHSVAVMNLWNGDGSAAQSMLTIVPLPTAAWAGLGSLAMVLGTGYIRRRNQQA